MIWRRREFFRFLGAAFGGSLLPAQGKTDEASAPTEAPTTLSPQADLDTETLRATHDIVVVGGGIAGVSAAISAARNGARVALVHERSMLGGNSSSEVRLYPENSTAHQVWIKECGIFDEIHTEERVRNHIPYREALMNCHWDLVLYEWVLREPNITLYLNTHMHRVLMATEGRIRAVYCIQLGSERAYELSAPLFIDATGDGVLAHRAGAECRWGREARSVHGEPLAPDTADEQIMGSTLFFRAIDTGGPVPFKRPDWAVEFNSEAEFIGRNHSNIEGGYWWLEVGPPYHPIHDNNAIVHEGLRHLLGVWDHIKNKGDHGADNYGLEFVGFWPYKRECRRIIGDYILTQQHLQDPQLLDDNVAYGVWFIDIHTDGILTRERPPYASHYADENWDAKSTRVYGIPLRALYSRNIENLMMAGRPISGSYVAFSSSRVLATGSNVGQAVGTAAALCTKYRITPRDVARRYVKECRQLLLRQDGYIPGVVNEDELDLARQARISASSSGTLRFPEANEEQPLKWPLAQIVPVSSDRIDRVVLHLVSSVDTDVELRLALRSAAHVWDFRGPTDLAEAFATVPARHDGPVEFRLNARVEREKLYYVYIPAQTGVAWRMHKEDDERLDARCPVGVTPASLPDKLYWRPFREGRSFCMTLTPESRPFGPENIARGINRPDMWTNLWMSDPAIALPAWLELEWSRPVRFNRAEFTFDTNMNRRVRLPLFRYPECVRDYTVECQEGGGWRTLVDERDNYRRCRVHTFDEIESRKLRLTVHATNGVPEARVYEMRVYHETPLHT